MIETVREWLAANQPLIYFVYGQVFFVTGMAIALQSRRNSRLKLARTLRWLAGFGLAHGLHEWGELFIPIQAEFLSSSIIHFLEGVDVILLTVSFAFLLQFGLELLWSSTPRWRWARLVVPALCLVWLGVSFGVEIIYGGNLELAHDVASALARYLLGLPGGLVAAYGLRYHAQQQIAPLNLPRIFRYLRIAGLALAAYGLFGGLLVPPVPFFPGNILNTETFTQVSIAPPPVFRSLAGFILAIFIIRALEVFEVETERLIERMEQEQVVAIERERIGRELHDGAIQQVYTAGLLAQAIRKQSDGPGIEKLDRLILTLNQAIADMRQFLSTLRPGDEPVNPSVALTPLVQEARQAFGREIEWEEQDLPPVEPGIIAHLVSFAREALSNAVRHSHANKINVGLQVSEECLELKIIDNGRGLPESVNSGFGLRNMRDRARLLGGDVVFLSTLGEGTTVTLSIPLEKHE